MARNKTDPFRFKVIADPVHGEVGLSELEVSLIDTQSFQRLRRLKQLGLASYVYPGASHSRFAHSLGVFHIMSRAIDLMVRRGMFNSAEQRKLRLVALLHDIGHYPYSHLVEYLDRDPDRRALLAGKKVRKSRRPYPDHEELGELIIQQRRDVSGLLKAARLDPTEIATIVRGEHREQRYNQLIHSTIDADRMDYLVRDALATGVPFGQIDVHYLLRNLDIDADGKLVLRGKAAPAAEHFVVARYFMTKAVYLHKTVFGFEALMRQALILLRERGKLWRDGAAIKKLVQNPTGFLDFHDGYVDALVARHADNRTSDPLTRLCRALRDRKPPALLLEVASLTPTDGERAEDLTRFITRRKDRLRDLARRLRIPLECWLWEDPKDIAFEKLGPVVTLAGAVDVPLEEMTELIHVADERGKTRALVEERSSILHHLSRLKFQMGRLYLVEQDADKIKRAKREVEAWLKP
ncbi:MAG: HD domain-containing protein [Phycisphaerae bacterium]|nr:HD domain-containing protein [Phycisphaerae bacterium]MCZ2398881.1 HD domain-containing protein [Phycisphaerae bacterium]